MVKIIDSATNTIPITDQSFPSVFFLINTIKLTIMLTIPKNIANKTRIKKSVSLKVNSTNLMYRVSNKVKSPEISPIIANFFSMGY